MVSLSPLVFALVKAERKRTRAEGQVPKTNGKGQVQKARIHCTLNYVLNPFPATFPLFAKFIHLCRARSNTRPERFATATHHTTKNSLS